MTVPPGYHELELLRRGSLLDVYDCWSVERRCRCVVKMVRPDRADEAQAHHRLLREARLLQRLAHPNIVRLLDLVTVPTPALVLETLTGATLSHLLTQHPRGLNPADVAILGLQLCSAIQYLHSNNILHLDVKPSNIVVAGGQAKVLDLDIARNPGRGRGEGTRQYMAPEQVARGMLTPATDVWSIGTVLFEAATGQLPFDFALDCVYPQLQSGAAPVRRLRRGIPAALAEAIDAALDEDSAARPIVDHLAHRLTTLVPDAPPWLAA